VGGRCRRWRWWEGGVWLTRVAWWPNRMLKRCWLACVGVVCAHSRVFVSSCLRVFVRTKMKKCVVSVLSVCCQCVGASPKYETIHVMYTQLAPTKRSSSTWIPAWKVESHKRTDKRQKRANMCTHIPNDVYIHIQPLLHACNNNGSMWHRVSLVTVCTWFIKRVLPCAKMTLLIQWGVCINT